MKTLTARDVMTSGVKSVDADWSLGRLAEFLMGNAISGAPVTNEDGRLLGVVSLTDIVRHDSVEVRAERPELTHEFYLDDLERQYAIEEIADFRFGEETRTVVRDVMTPMVFEVPPDADVHQLADTMVRGRIHRVFVTEARRVVGVVSALDLLQVVREL